MAKLSVEAEYQAIASATYELIWLKKFLKELTLLHKFQRTMINWEVSSLSH